MFPWAPPTQPSGRLWLKGEGQAAAYADGWPGERKAGLGFTVEAGVPAF